MDYSKKVPREIYEKILEHSIICALDGIVLQNEKILLALRKQEPAKGKLWIPGGRQFKGELPEEGIVKRIKEETNLEVKVIKLIGMEDLFFDKTEFQNVKTGVHYLSRIYLVKPTSPNQKVQLDDTQRTHIWIDKKWYEQNKNGLHKYVQKHIDYSGVFK